MCLKELYLSEKYLHFRANTQFSKINAELPRQDHINKQIWITNITNICLKTLEKNIRASHLLSKRSSFYIMYKCSCFEIEWRTDLKSKHVIDLSVTKQFFSSQQIFSGGREYSSDNYAEKTPSMSQASLRFADFS